MGKNIVVAFGGVSPEHEVSVITAIQAASAISGEGHQLRALYITKAGRMLTGDHLLDLESYKNMAEAEAKATPCTFRTGQTGRAELAETGPAGLFSKPKSWPVDVVLVAFHGSDGENGSFQGLCETFNIPYTGSGVMASSAGLDKRTAKILAASLGIPVVPDVFITEAEWAAGSEKILSEIEALGTDIVVKPMRLGSSIGVERVKGREEIIRAVETGFRYDSRLLAEKAVTPLMEINCSVLGDGDAAEASVCEQPVGKEERLSFEDKYMGDEGKGMASASRIIPAPVEHSLTDAIRDASVKLFQSMDAAGVARFDFLVNRDSREYYFNEINTIPGSFSFYLWEKTDLPFPKLVNRLVDIAIERHRQKSGRVRSYETNLLSSKAVKGIKGLKGKG
jgi:D-alanine-D-alanine ligase